MPPSSPSAYHSKALLSKQGIPTVGYTVPVAPGPTAVDCRFVSTCGDADAQATDLRWKLQTTELEPAMYQDSATSKPMWKQNTRANTGQSQTSKETRHDGRSLRCLDAFSDKARGLEHKLGWGRHQNACQDTTNEHSE